MMIKKMAVSALALTVGASGASLAADVTSTSFSGGVALLSPEPTGFRHSAQLGVDGVGTGAVTVSVADAEHRFVGFAVGGTADAEVAGAPDDATAGAGVLATFDFDRSVATNGSLAGSGNVFATGTSTGASGFSGAAFGTSEFSGVQDGDAFTASADSEAEAGLAGSIRTLNTLNLRGGDSFAGTQGTEVGGQDTAISFARLEVFSGDPVAIAPLELATVDAAGTAFFGAAADGTTPAVNPVNGVGFTVVSALEDDIALAISSTGGGLQTLEVDTGGFFTGGAAAFGENQFGFASAAEED